MRLQRRKRKERDATTSGTPWGKRIVTDVLAELGYGKDAEVQEKVVTVFQSRSKEVGEEETRQEDYGEEETGSQVLTKAQLKQRNLLLGGHGSGKDKSRTQSLRRQPPPPLHICRQDPHKWVRRQHMVLGCLIVSWHPGPNVSTAGRVGEAKLPQDRWSLIRAHGRVQGHQVFRRPQASSRPSLPPRSKLRRLAWREEEVKGKEGKAMVVEDKEVKGVAAEEGTAGDAVVDGTDKEGRIKAAKVVKKGAKDMEGPALIGEMSSADIVALWATPYDFASNGGTMSSPEAQRRAAVGTAPPAMFIPWQEREDPPVRIEEVIGETEEVTQRLKAGTIKKEPIVVESDDEDSREVEESSITILEKMKDLLEKVGRYQQRLKELCNAQEWKADLPRVFLYESGPGSASGQQGYPGVAPVGSGPRSGMTFRPPTPHGRAPQATQTRSQSKAGPNQVPSQAPSRRRPEPERRKEVVEVPEEEDEEDDDTEDERLRQEEDRRTELRAQRRGNQEEAEPGQQDSAPKKRKYAVRLEEGFDVERMVDRLLEGTHSLAEEIRTIEEGPAQVEEHEQLMGGMYLLTNTLLQGDFDRKNSLSPVEGEDPVPESQDDEFEQGEIKEAFRAEEYDGIYLELGLLLSFEIRDRDESAKTQKMRHLYVVGATEERIREASKHVERSQMEDKMRWDQMARVRKEPLAVGDIVLLYDSSLEKQWSRKLDKRLFGPYRIVRCGEFGAYQIKELDGTEWKDWVSGTRLKKFVARE
ncbi:hypothetical protein CBR_g40283 [Chara braunii]|uniref:Uncharacterized protein n=1 Tax=Chara braunii TaxID=69332 RepID=A0A388K1X1_CHABU|nr:hypothetical protein CBR_g40283 [Chara braunii]|eukprot:GBG64036.1 hypothetical protein CBR_g40283 [Chara braunii]